VTQSVTTTVITTSILNPVVSNYRIDSLRKFG
jgi:hypothetical protein